MAIEAGTKTRRARARTFAPRGSTPPQRSPCMKNDPAARPGVQRHIQGFLQAVATGWGRPIEQMTPREARAVLEGLQSRVKVDLPQADVTELTISSERQTVKVAVVRPAGVTGRLPVFMFFHGGGWVLGDFPTHE